jgi:putative hydrolase of the HAD superfamily
VSDYRAVIFDFGGVITVSPLLGMRSYCEQVGIPWDSLRTLFALEEGAWSRFEMSALSEDEFVPVFELEAVGIGHTIDGREFLKAFFAGMALRPEMVAVVRTLRRQPALRIGCITNNVQVTSRRRLVLLDELFDVVVESSKVGMRKPNPAIYTLACELLGVEPHESIFLDDFGINLKAARALGMATIKVDETHSAIDELERLLNIPLPRSGEEETISGGDGGR